MCMLDPSFLFSPALSSLGLLGQDRKGVRIRKSSLCFSRDRFDVSFMTFTPTYSDPASPGENARNRDENMAGYFRKAREQKAGGGVE